MNIYTRTAILITFVAATGCTSVKDYYGMGPQKSFKSPEAAVNAFAAALRSDSKSALKEILGPGADDVLDSGDPVQARNDAENFLHLYDQRHATSSNGDGSLTLVVGDDSWPFPIPLVHDGNRWRFDTERGKEEIINRRIGRNELSTLQVCRGLVDAQREYKSMNPEGNGAFASKLVSDPGKKNGLYWPAEEGSPPSPAGEFIARASGEGYRRDASGQPVPFHGYYYKLLTSQGPAAPGGAKGYLVNGVLTDGFAVLAWPADYQNSGVMTFLVNQLGVVYQRDLGPETATLGPAIQTFDPDPQWDVCED